MKLFSQIPSWLKNKYFISLTAFIIWMLFFDARDMISQRQRSRELQELQKSKSYFTQEIAKEKKSLEELKTDPTAIEKYAREKYLMKRDNEDLFIIEKPEKE